MIAFGKVEVIRPPLTTSYSYNVIFFLVPRLHEENKTNYGMAFSHWNRHEGWENATHFHTHPIRWHRVRIVKYPSTFPRVKNYSVVNSGVHFSIWILFSSARKVSDVRSEFECNSRQLGLAAGAGGLLATRCWGYIIQMFPADSRWDLTRQNPQNGQCAGNLICIISWQIHFFRYFF